MVVTAEKKVKKYRTTIFVPDWIALKIDEIAIGRYGKRSDFLTSAMRNFMDMMIETSHDVLLENLEIDAGHDFQYVRYYTRVNEEFDNILDKYPKPKRKEGKTNFSVYLTNEEEEWMKLFYKGNKRLKNIQKFARYAALYELDRIQAIEGYLIDLKDFVEKKKFDLESFKKELETVSGKNEERATNQA